MLTVDECAVSLVVWLVRAWVWANPIYTYFCSQIVKLIRIMTSCLLFWMSINYVSTKRQRRGLLCVCVCALPGSFLGMGAFYFKIEIRGILNTTPLTRITAHIQS